MNKIKYVVLLLCLIAPLCLQANSTTQNKKVLAYIKQYKTLAVEEMHYSGIPASITMAQAILESRYGRSDLATQANNHFGIKCKIDWTGETFYADDDQPNECFRKYPSVEVSFRDHSNFVKYNRLKFYDFLFDLDKLDYEAWAYGLKKAGYATSKRYAQKLIHLIEKYELYELDYLNEDGSPNQKLLAQRQRATTKNTSAETVKVVETKPKESTASTEPDMHVSPYVKKYHLVQEGDNMEDIARTYKVDIKQLYKYNWMPTGTEPEIGEEIVLNDYAPQRPKLKE